MHCDPKSRILELAIKALDGDISPEESQELEGFVSSSKALAAYYSTCIKTHLCMVELEASQRLAQETGHSEFDPELWQMMTIHEHIAPPIEIPREKPQRELIQKVIYPPLEKRKVSKLSVIFLAMNAAAMFFIVLFLKFAPTKPVEVATLSDSMNAKWADVDFSIHEGTRLATNSDTLMLKEGLAELSFDNHAKAIIEAPAEFQILADDRIGLNYGRVYAIVPKEAIGFSVYTPNAKIVDMGTEFGVLVEAHGDMQLHVLKGKTMLMPGEKNSGTSMEVCKGAAKKIDGDTQTVTDIPCDQTRFVRGFDSANNVVWRRQASLDLADIVQGGNGLGTGSSAVRLDPRKGLTTDWHFGIVAASNRYLSIPGKPFIDGVFVPDGGTPQIVSSRGDVFHECPDTSGLFDIDLYANPKPGVFKTEFREGTIRFDGQEYTDESGKACIIMHANHGLTFDLDAIRKSYHHNIDRFISRIGIADLNEPHPCNADFYVLVDGQIRYSLRQYKQKGVLNDVSVEINDTDRFLTLMTTDGSDPDDPQADWYHRAITCDWCVFTEPVLVLE